MDIELLKTSLFSHNWGRFFALDCPLMAWNYFFRVICETVDRLCPTREFRILESRPAWYSDEIDSYARNWERLHRIGKRSKIPEKINKARIARNKLKDLITKCKKNIFYISLNYLSAIQKNSGKCF